MFDLLSNQKLFLAAGLHVAEGFQEDKSPIFPSWVWCLRGHSECVGGELVWESAQSEDSS